MAKTRPYVIAVAPPPGDRREHKKARTRDELVQAAIRLFIQKGFETTTVEDIAAAAGVSPRTFFRYFANKEEVVFPGKDEELANMQAALSKRPAEESALQALRAAAIEYLTQFQIEPEFHHLRLRLIREAPSLAAYELKLHQEWIRQMARALARRMQVDPTSDLRPLLLAGCAVIAMRSSLVPWMRSKGALDIRMLVNQAFDQIRDGLAG